MGSSVMGMIIAMAGEDLLAIFGHDNHKSKSELSTSLQHSCCSSG
jgi:hypothetical protein